MFGEGSLNESEQDFFWRPPGHWSGPVGTPLPDPAWLEAGWGSAPPVSHPIPDSLASLEQTG